MTEETKRIIKRALDNYRGDDLERALAAFRGCTPEQMQQEYGQSGKTRQAIVDGYRTHVEAVKRAQLEVAVTDNPPAPAPVAVSPQEILDRDDYQMIEHEVHRAQTFSVEYRERQDKIVAWARRMRYIAASPSPLTDEARLRELLEQWRREAAEEQRVSFHADELEAVLSSLASAPAETHPPIYADESAPSRQPEASPALHRRIHVPAERRQRQDPHARPARLVRRRDGRQAPDLRGVDPVKAKTPKALDSIVDLVLAYRPKAKSKPARRRKRRAAKIAKAK